MKTESSAGLAPAAAAAAALVLANSPLSGDYFRFLAAPVALQIGDFAQTASVEVWIRDGLMTLFFLVVGLEIKFEMLRGELSSARRLATPILAAAGGMIVPAVVYLAFNAGAGGALRGWPVGCATDIAFALAALALAAPRAPASLRLFLLTLAIADDFGAVGLVAVVFSNHLDWGAAAGAAVVLLALAALSRVRRGPLLLYAVGFILVWGFCLKSGVSTSVAGIACALTVPVGARRPGGESMLTLFMEALHPWVAYGVLPLFAFAAAGFSFRGLDLAILVSPAALGVALALLIGKPLGVFGVTAGAAVLRLARRPAGATWLELFGVAQLTGVGFTMSLYLAALAFETPMAQTQARLGVFAGSLASIAVGAGVLAIAGRRREAAGGESED